MFKKIIKKILPKSLKDKIILKRQNIKLLETKYEPTVTFAYGCDVRYSTLGSYSSVGRYAKITHTDIGKYCAISWDITINAVSHPYEHLTVHSFPYVPAPGFVDKRMQEHKRVVIGNDVWIGANSVIMPGIKIGNGAIIGAGAVVTKDIPDYAIVAGVPAKIIKYRFSQEIIEKLLQLEWWNLEASVIKQNINLWQKEVNLATIEKLEKLC